MSLLSRLRSITAKTPLVLSVDQYAQLPTPSSVIPIDVSWHMPAASRNPAAEYQARRLPRARFLNLDEVADRTHPLGLPHMMPSPTIFAQTCRTLGITRSSHVVFYDTVGVFSSPRALFMFKGIVQAFGHENASILDGGLPAWVSRGLPTEEGPSLTHFATTEYPDADVVLDTSVLRTYEDMLGNSKKVPYSDPTADVVFDARSAARFDGIAPEPRAGMSSGHIPHSYSLPFHKLLEEHPHSIGEGSYTTMRSPFEIIKIIESSLSNGETVPDLSHRNFVNTCGSGMTAAIIWLALQRIGIDSAIYDESWMGYASRAESPIIKKTGHDV